MNVFTTLDIYLASYLTLSGFEVKFKTNHAGRITFSTPLTNEVQEALSEYRTAFVPAKIFVDTIKNLKKKMYDFKDREEGSTNGNADS